MGVRNSRVMYDGWEEWIDEEGREGERERRVRYEGRKE